MKRCSLLILFIFYILLVGCKVKETAVSSAVPNERFNSLKKIINEKISKDEIPSVSVALAENGKIIWMESFGWADKENKIKASPNTLYSIASLSKPLTATGIMKLHKQGKLHLDEDIQTYMGTLNMKYYGGDSVKVTCRNLLNHTSGLSMYFSYYYDDNKQIIPAFQEVLANYGFLVTLPSSKYSYSNLGYGILGTIISEITGMDFNKYMIDEIFSPLGMVHTTFDISARTKGKLAKRYDFQGNLLPYSFADSPGSANASSTVRDLICFGMFHLNGQSQHSLPVLSKRTIQSMQQVQYPDNSNNRNTCGLGWFINEKDYKYKVVYHAGGMDGVEAMLKLVPSKNITVAALVNQSTKNAKFTNEITDLILSEVVPDLKDVQENQNSIGEANDIKVVEQKDLLGQWAGHIKTHDDSIPLTLIFQEDGDIHVYTKAQFDSSLLSPAAQNSFQHKMLLNKWFFDNGHLMGWYAEMIPGPYVERCPHVTLLDLEYRSEKLKGIAVALASSKRMYYGISHYVELEKIK